MTIFVTVIFLKPEAIYVETVVIPSSANTLLQDSKRVCTYARVLQLFIQQMIRVFPNGKVSTLATGEYFLIAFFAQRKRFISQSKVFAIDDRNLFFGILNLRAFQVSTKFCLQLWCTRTLPSPPLCKFFSNI